MCRTEVANHAETRTMMRNLHGETKLERVSTIQRTWSREVTGVVEVGRYGAEELVVATVANEARQRVGSDQVHRRKPWHRICQLLFVRHLQRIVGGAAFRNLEVANTHIAVDTAKGRAAQVSRPRAEGVAGIQPITGKVVDVCPSPSWVEARTGSNRTVDRGGTAGCQRLGDGRRRRRRIQEARVANVVFVNRKHEAGAYVADVVRGKHAAFPDLVLHADVELIGACVTELWIKYSQTLTLADLQSIANEAGVGRRSLGLHSRLKFLL